MCYVYNPPLPQEKLPNKVDLISLHFRKAGKYVNVTIDVLRCQRPCLSGNVGVVLEGEVTLGQRDPAGGAVVVELLAGRLK